MHELSIAHSLVELASEAAGVEKAESIKALNLVVGALSCVSPDALEYCFELAAEGSALEGAVLRIRRVPVVIHCGACQLDVELPGIQSFRCPRCKTPSSDVRQGRELEIESLEIETLDVDESDREAGKSEGAALEAVSETESFASDEESATRKRLVA